MRLSTVLVSALAVAVSAAPTFPDINLKDVVNPDDTLESLSEYFNVLATKVQLAKVMSNPPVCDVSKAQMPQAPDALPSPSEGLKVGYVAVGRGTQNYTCDAGNKDAEPEAAGALATLFNASCIAALYPDLLDRIPDMAVRFNLNDTENLGPSALKPAGKHYFTDSSTAFFDLGAAGSVPTEKDSSADPPATAAKGQKGENAVAWLKLSAKKGSTSPIKEVYRTVTAGGSPPATCEGMPAKFEVQYAASYWFWEGEIKDDGGDE